MRRHRFVKKYVTITGKFFATWNCVAVGLVAATDAATIDLDEYVLDQTYNDIGSDQNPDPVIDNLSGLTYNSVTDTLFAVLNGPELLLELDPLSGNILRQVELDNFVDTEGIVHLGGTRFGIVEERGDRNFVTIDLGSAVTTIDRNDTLVSTIIPLGDPGANSRQPNSGLEGVAYDPITDTVYAVWEKEDPTIRSFDLSDAEASPNSTPTFSTPFQGSAVISPTTLNPFTDLAGLHFHSPTNTLLILGEENKEIIEINPITGATESGSILLTSGAGNYMEQPEGLTVGPNGTLYVVGEADDLFVFVGPELSIPEPSAISLMILCSLSLLRRRRR